MSYLNKFLSKLCSINIYLSWWSKLKWKLKKNIVLPKEAQSGECRDFFSPGYYLARWIDWSLGQVLRCTYWSDQPITCSSGLLNFLNVAPIQVPSSLPPDDTTILIQIFPNPLRWVTQKNENLATRVTSVSGTQSTCTSANKWQNLNFWTCPLRQVAQRSTSLSDHPDCFLKNNFYVVMIMNVTWQYEESWCLCFRHLAHWEAGQYVTGPTFYSPVTTGQEGPINIVFFMNLRVTGWTSKPGVDR